MNRRGHLKQKHVSFGSIVIMTILVLYMLSLLLPLFWALVSSLKTRLDYAENVFGFPRSKWAWENYATAFNHFTSKNGVRTVYIEEMLLNSLIYAVGGSFLSTFVTCVMAYVSSRFKFKIGKVIYAIVVIAMILPVVGSLPSGIQITKALHLYDNYAGLLILQCSFLGIYFLVFYETFKSIPKDYSDAAYVDGAGNLMTFLRVILPMVRSTFFTIMLIKFVGLWNDYNITLEYMPSIKTLAFGLYEYTRSQDAAISTTPMRLAGSNLLAVPVILFYLAFHKRLIGNFTQGGLKG